MLNILFLSMLMTPLASSMAVISANNGRFSGHVTNQSYWQKREQLINEDYASNLGRNVMLTEQEEVLNEILMKYKNKDFKKYFSSLHFPPSLSFFKSRDTIEKSRVFQIIKKMPKGAVLHAHDLSLTSVDWVISELTYWDDLYICQDGRNSALFKFFSVPDDTCNWKLLKDERSNATSAEDFDQFLYDQLSIFTPTPEEDYPDIDSVWRKMEEAYRSLIGLVSFAPAWVRYLEQAMKEHIEDNVLYFEFRGVLPLLYDKNGTIYSEMETVEVYNQVIKNFTECHDGEFLGARFIFAPGKSDDLSEIWKYVQLAQEMKVRFPSLVAGFDLVGQEDKRPSLKAYIEPLLALANGPVPVPVFFHAGETDWYGMESDENLFDAILFNATRLGHAYALTKHPVLMDMVKKADIPIEVCPISNQVLMLVKDLRNHPMVEVISRGMEVVVSSDDPAVWGATPLSHDFYEAFYGLGGAKADLRFLKKLAMNSIRYCTLGNNEKNIFQSLWQKKWNIFVKNEVEGLLSPENIREKNTLFYI